MLVNTPPPHPSFDMYNNNNNSRFADSGYLSRTPTPPTPSRIPSPQPTALRQELDDEGMYSNKCIVLHHFLFAEIDSRISDKSFVETKPRLPYVKRTRIQYTLQQVRLLLLL